VKQRCSRLGSGPSAKLLSFKRSVLRGISVSRFYMMIIVAEGSFFSLLLCAPMGRCRGRACDSLRRASDGPISGRRPSSQLRHSTNNTTTTTYIDSHLQGPLQHCIVLRRCARRRLISLSYQIGQPQLHTQFLLIIDSGVCPLTSTHQHPSSSFR